MSNRATYQRGHNLAQHGPPNPKTMVPPVMSNRLNDFDAWNDSVSAVKSGINTQRIVNIEPFLSIGNTPDPTNIWRHPNNSNNNEPFLSIGNTPDPTNRWRHSNNSNNEGIMSSTTFLENANNIKERGTDVIQNALQYIGGGRSEGFTQSKDVDAQRSALGNVDAFSNPNLRSNLIVPSNSEVALKNADYRSGFKNSLMGNTGYDTMGYSINPNQFQQSSNLSLRDYGKQGPGPLDLYKNDIHTSRIQPGMSYRNDFVEPINDNIGISYLPEYQYVEKTHRDVADGDGYLNNDTNVTFTRIDPQLVRDNESKNRREENPTRNSWSQKYSNLEAAPGTVAESDIYDPRLTGAGDGYRSYVDQQLGQVRYYYGDVDAIRQPNYIVRSKIDNFDFATPMGAVLPDYIRTPLEKNARGLAETQFMRDTIEHRESLMGSQMKKINTNSWQRRYAPIRQF